MRLRFIQARNADRANRFAAQAFMERLGQRRSADAILEFGDELDISAAAGLRFDQIHWLPVAADAITSEESAARFCIDLLRTDTALRVRFPDALSARASGAFAVWVVSDSGAKELGISRQAASLLVAVLGSDLAARARKTFLYEQELHQLLPDGLLPSGQRLLFEWFMQRGRAAHSHSLEEIWWLFMEAAEQPREELWRAYLFTPAWQSQFPDGLTRFGRDAFAQWARRTLRLSGDWSCAAAWPTWQPMAREIRIAHCARNDWQAIHPTALSSVPGALALLRWLTSPQSGLNAAVRAELGAADHDALSREIVTLGVNVIGHFSYPSGLRVSVESIVAALDQVRVDTSLRDVRTDAMDDCTHDQFDGLEWNDITLIHTQPEPFFLRSYELADVAERKPRTYRIGYWYWEFDSIPETWVGIAAALDEVWAATEFVAKGLREKLQIPVRTMFPGVRLAPFTVRPRKHFGLNEDEFTFLFTFHMVSIMERKNPLGLIRAFRNAFEPADAARLVLKVSFGDRYPEQMETLREAIGDARITVIDAVYSPDEVLSLMENCDAYVSLHRSEGLGLTMAEAMLMGKPVIATAFSGNVDFMDEDNSMPVPYELVKVGRSIPPYDAESDWAEPSLEDAAVFMRRLFENPRYAQALGARAKASAEVKLSLQAAGRAISSRLAEISDMRVLASN